MLSLGDNKESQWPIRVAVDLVDRKRCSRRPAQNANKSAKFLLSPEKTDPFIARTASQNARIAAAKSFIAVQVNKTRRRNLAGFLCDTILGKLFEREDSGQR